MKHSVGAAVESADGCWCPVYDSYLHCGLPWEPCGHVGRVVLHFQNLLPHVAFILFSVCFSGAHRSTVGANWGPKQVVELVHGLRRGLGAGLIIYGLGSRDEGSPVQRPELCSQRLCIGELHLSARWRLHERCR